MDQSTAEAGRPAAASRRPRWLARSRLPGLAWWRGASLRGRLILIGAAGVAAGLALGGVVLVEMLSYTLQRNLDQTATRTAEDVAAMAEAGRLPDPVPVGLGAAAIQVLDADGQVTAASPGADRLIPTLTPGELASVDGGGTITIRGDRLGLDGPVQVAAQSARRDGQTSTVLVAVAARDQEMAVHAVRSILLVAFPLLVAILALLAWRVVGLTLRPVEALRRGAAEITGAGTVGRLPVPSGKDEVHRLALTLNDMLARIEAGRRRQRAFVADAAHELRSPLASMRTQVDVASRLDTRADWPDTAAGLLADLDRLGRLTDDLLLLARADEGMVAHPTGEVELTALAREVVGRYDDARVPVRVDEGARGRVNGDADHLRRVVANLLDNAVRHAASGVVVRVDREVDGAGAVTVALSVADDGEGIPEADRERVFDRFTRLDDARARDEGGAGLGLAIVAELVRLHRGSVTLTDAAPGVRAEVRLPALDR